MGATLQEQIKLERQYKEYARELFISRHQKEQQKGRGASTQTGKGLQKHITDDLLKAITAWLEAEIAPKRGVQKTYKDLLVALVEAVGSEEVILNACAFVFESVINSVVKGRGEYSAVSSIAGDIGLALFYECKLEALLKNLNAYQHSKVIVEEVKKRNLIRYKWNYIEEVTETEQFKFYKPTQEAIKSLGMALIDVFQYATGLIELESDKKSKSLYIVPSDYLVELWAKNMDNISTKVNLVTPTIIPPKPWVSLTEGGYYDVASQNVNFMRLTWGSLKTRTGKAYVRKLSEVDLTEVMGAVNKIQETAYCINKKVLTAVKYLVSKGGDCAGIVNLEPKELPPELVGEYTPEDLKKHKELIKRVREDNRSSISRAMRVYKTVNFAEDFSKYEKIYFPCNIDFRGRIYPIPYFNHQGDDLMKAMLLYAEPVACEHEEDLQTLQIQGSNLWGNDKVGYQAQCDWVEENTDKILLTAHDYLVSDWWQQADEPLQFLAFCYEYAECLSYIKDHGSIKGYVCKIPIAFDGTCSGLQHYSAMLLDTVGGKAVNLTAGGERPEDIYQQVADGVLQLVEKDAKEGTADTRKVIKNKFKKTEDDPEEIEHTEVGTKTLAQAWLSYGITRKVCKRPVMTLAYGSGEYGFGEQLFEDIVHKQKEFKGFEKIASKYLAKKIAIVVKDVVVSAVSGMDFLKKLAGEMNKEDIPVNWWTPLGLPVQQNYLSTEKKYIQTRLGGTKRVRLYWDEPKENEEVNKKSQVNGIAPNFIHSLDSTHLMMVVNEAGLNNYTTIHDSFGTSLGETKVLKRVLREQLYKLYTEFKPLETFKKYVELELNKELPKIELPKTGKLNLEEILISKYVFH